LEPERMLATASLQKTLLHFLNGNSNDKKEVGFSLF
jgi:hypothetical protein